MAEKNQATSGGISFGGLLTVLFIALKLAHVINWSWWWVLSPIWISLVLVTVIFVVAVAVIAVFDK